MNRVEGRKGMGGSSRADRRPWVRVIGLPVAVVVFVTAAVPAAGQERLAELSEEDTLAVGLEDALARALDESEEVQLARARLDVARAQTGVARSALLPRINTQIAYTRTLRSVFQGAGFSVPDSLRFDPDPDESIAERVRYLEQNTPNAAFGALGSLFSNLPFGREHAWNGGITVSQPVFTGGRILSSMAAASSAADAARASLNEAEADVALQVTEAYYGAVLADNRVEIMEASAQLALQHLERVRLLLDAGRASELEVLRAEVELYNLRPELVRARNARSVAMLNLKRLVNLPADVPLELTTALDAGITGGEPAQSAQLPTLAEASTALARRAAVRAARSRIAAREERVDIAQSTYWPSVSLTGNLGWQAFPSGMIPTDANWRGNWTVGFAVRWPLFQGLQRTAEVDAAQAQLKQAELQLDQLRERVRLDYERARAEFERAGAQIEAADRTVEQAERVYELTRLRFREGMATQLDVSDARLALQQARLNRVGAYHDFRVALARAERALGRPLIGLNGR